MNHREAFIQDIREHPDDDGLRLIYADWLEDNDEPERAEFIRLQCRLTAGRYGKDERDGLREREGELLQAHGVAWCEELPPWAREKAVFRRGLVEEVSGSATAFLATGTALFQAAPVRRLCIQELGGAASDLAACQHLAHLTSLQLKDERLSPDALGLLLSSRYLGALRDLWLGQSPLGPTAGAEVLAKSPCLAHLSALSLRHTGLSNEGVAVLASSPSIAQLTFLVLGDNGLGLEAVEALAASPHLARLGVLYLDRNALLGDAAALALARSPHFSALTHLNLCETNLTATGIEALVAAPWLRQVQSLHLGTNRIGNEGAAVLAGSPNLSALRDLWLESSGIGDAGVSALAASPHLAALELLYLVRNAAVGQAGALALVRSPFLGRLKTIRLGESKIGAEALAALHARFGDEVTASE